MSKWESTKYPGVRFRKHVTRKHGVKFDQYFTVRYQKDGIRHEEALGWVSDGWSVEKANAELAKLKEAARVGDGPQRLFEKRVVEKQRRDELERTEESNRKASITFKDYFINSYFPDAQVNKKKRSTQTEKALFELWINPSIGSLSFAKIDAFHIRAIKKKMLDAGRSLRTIKYAYSVISQVWNHACSDKLIHKKCPIKDKTVTLGKINNNRVRFLSYGEAEELLAALLKISPQIHDIALMSLQTGMRAGEIFKLTWDCIDFSQRTIFIKDAKANNSRYVFMTQDIKEMLVSRHPKRIGLVFKNRKGKIILEGSKTFDRVVDKLGFNLGIKDRRNKVVFHTLRHTFASWLAMSGIDIYTIKNLMGHSTIKMTERYAHFQESSLKKAITVFDQSLETFKNETKSKRVSFN